MSQQIIPKYLKIGNLNLIIEKYTDERFNEVFKLLQDSMTDSAGKDSIVYLIYFCPLNIEIVNIRIQDFK